MKTPSTIINFQALLITILNSQMNNQRFITEALKSPSPYLLQSYSHTFDKVKCCSLP